MKRVWIVILLILAATMPVAEAFYLVDPNNGQRYLHVEGDTYYDEMYGQYFRIPIVQVNYNEVITTQGTIYYIEPTEQELMSMYR